MYYKVYKCNCCGDEQEANDPDGHYMDLDGETCPCGGTYRSSSKSYDQEFIDEQKRDEQQDREYEERRRQKGASNEKNTTNVLDNERRSV